MFKRYWIILLVICLSQAHAIKNKLPMRHAGWATLSGGYTLSEKYHGAIDFNFKFDQNMYALQFQVFQICDEFGCVTGPHSAYNFLYGQAYNLNSWATVYAQSGLSVMQIRNNCSPVGNPIAVDGLGNPLFRNECGESTEAGLPLRVGIQGGHFVGVSLEFIAIVTPNRSIIGGQFGIPLGVF